MDDEVVAKLRMDSARIFFYFVSVSVSFCLPLKNSMRTEIALKIIFGALGPLIFRGVSLGWLLPGLLLMDEVVLQQAVGWQKV